MYEKMELQDIIDNYRPAYADTWDNWLKMELPPTTRLLVDRLKDEYIQYGKFTDPIVIIKDEHKSQVSPHCGYVSDGMHRIRALYEMKEKFAHVSHNYDHADFPYAIIIEYIPGEKDYDDLFEMLSFKYQDNLVDTWITHNGSLRINNIEYTTLLGKNIEHIDLKDIFPILHKICEKFDCQLIRIKLVKYDDNFEEIVIRTYE